MKIKQKIFISIIATALIYIIAIFILIPFDSIIPFFQNKIIIIGITAISAFALTSLIIFLTTRNISHPISDIFSFLKNMSSGKTEIPNNLKQNRKDEIGNITRELTKINNTILDVSNFTNQLNEGNLENYNIETKNENSLSKNLYEISEYIISAEKEKKYSLEENKKIQWYQNGIAEFADVLQRDFESISEMSDIVVKKIVKYIKIEQAAIFVLHNKNEHKTLILEASYAYDKKKSLDTEIEIGEGLVGKCAQEKEVIKIDNLPEGYTFISSGLGEDTPKTLLLVPVIFENNLFGIIEIASLYNIPEYKIEFIKSIGEKIAAEISNLQTGYRTKELAENLKIQAEELENKEKEALSTIRELQEVRDKLENQATESSGVMKALVSVASVVFYDTDGHITNINQKNQELFNIKKEDCIGKTHFEILPDAKENPDWFNNFWKDLRQGKTRTKEYYIKNEDKEMWLFETYTPILDKNGKTEKVINIGIDITEQKLLELKLKSNK